MVISFCCVVTCMDVSTSVDVEFGVPHVSEKEYESSPSLKGGQFWTKSVDARYTKGGI